MKVIISESSLTLDPGRIHKEHMTYLVDNVYEVFCAEPNVLIVPSSVTVCGDIHGQYYGIGTENLYLLVRFTQVTGNWR